MATLLQPADCKSTATPWLFSAPVDLLAFLGSALLALALLAWGYLHGELNQETPQWTWVGAVLLIDVAHVYATAFRVYFVPRELQRRPWLYLLTPLVAYLLGAALFSESEAWFWRSLAYLAVFHFVRQQYGWVAMYRAKAGERDQLGWWIDSTAIYAATIYPLLYWHAHLPRQFWWFIDHDFATIPAIIAQLAAPLYWLALATYAMHSCYRGWIYQRWNPGKDLVVATTALCWYLGIVACNSDYAFTVTNVIIHGVPYLVLVYWLNVRPEQASHVTPRRSTIWRKAFLFLATLWFLAYAEELLWDRSLWHERDWLFGSAWELDDAKVWLVPLLAVPQITHYVLDGFIWRRNANPDLAARLR
ncbi:MAG TPA: hypothetical protein VL096_04160 [Pirellulaceae bacterium]|nr:hypothetical protein [Pirellulaceae bacterium]